MADFYFGNMMTGLLKRPAPKTGMDASSAGVSDVLEFANGGAYVTLSDGTHREFDMSWAIGEKSTLDFLNDYRNGRYGTGLLYMVDPFATNHMPPHWANPALTCRGWPSLLAPAVRPVLGYATTRINETINPSFTTNVAGWNGVVAAPLTWEAGRGKLTVGSAVAANAILLSEATATPYTIGTLKSARMKVTNSRATSAQFRVSIRGYNASSAQVGTDVYGPIVTIPANSTAELIVSGANLTTAGTVSYKLCLWTVSALAVGNIVYVDDVITETGAVAGGYFDGYSKGLGGLAATWAGTPDASNSLLPMGESAKYTLSGAAGEVPQRMLTLLIPEDRDLYIGFSGSAVNAAVRMQTITREGLYGPVQDVTLLDPSASVRMNTKVSGGAYKAVQVYMTPTATGVATVTLVSSKAIYALPTETPVLTGEHIPGEGHTGLRFNGEPMMTYVQAANGRKKVSAAATFTEIEAWL